VRHGPAILADPTDSAEAEPMAYLDFVKAKIARAVDEGLPVAANNIHPALKPFNRDIVAWAIAGGRRAIFARFGLHKTIMQLELGRLVRRQLDGMQLQIAPLNVILEGTFAEDAARIGVELLFVQSDAEIEAAIARGFVGQYITNYESVREGKIGAERWNCVALDEADCLRGMGGTKTFREFMDLFPAVTYRFVATATPSPNDHVELLAYAAFLGIMDIAQAKTRFFKRNSEKADALTILPHMEDQWWAWVNSWACFVQAPSDLGYSDEGYSLPPIRVRWHEVPSDHSLAGADTGGQGRLLKKEAIGVVEASREKRESIGARIAKLMELRAEDPEAARLIWHDLEAEREAIERAIPGISTVYGSQDLDRRRDAFQAFKAGRARELATKPVIAGAGGNYQRVCAWEIFLGIGFKFRDFIQAIHRVQRFGQPHEVLIDIIYTEAERAVRAELERKWRDHDATCARMSEIIRRHGLGLKSAVRTMERSIELGDGRRTERSDRWEVHRNDAYLETARMESDSVGLVLTSIPFATQFEYSHSYNDLGHTSGLPEFFAQLGYLTRELFRVLQPGRNLAVHVKDRVIESGRNGLGFRTIEPFAAACIDHYRAAGFGFIAQVTIVTDVVRENAQSYRLGWSEQCKDSTGMGHGLPEYLLIFRKPPSDRSNGYADVPVVKPKPKIRIIATGEIVDWDKKLVDAKEARPVEGTGYSRARWQTDACGYWRSNGDRLLTGDDLVGLPWRKIYQLFRGWSYATIYDHEGHVACMEAVESRWSLPPDFALMPVQSWHPDVWTDVARMRGANTLQASDGREQHLCPLPFDIVDRVILGRSNPGDLVFDPFGGLMTVPLRAVKHGRRGAAVELSEKYFADGVRLLREQDRGKGPVSLFDLMETESDPEAGPDDDEDDGVNDVMEAAE
jgi:hypothetical protein